MQEPELRTKLIAGLASAKRILRAQEKRQRRRLTRIREAAK
jgi:hypothetical protein